MSPVFDFDKLTQDLATARMMLKERVLTLEAAVATLKKKELPAIRKWAENAAEKQQILKDAIEAYPEYFVKPKTKILNGIKFGYRKSNGEISWEDGSQVIRLIKKHFSDQVDILIKTKETPIKTALEQLSATDLKKIGVTVGQDGEDVFIKFTDSDIDKIVNAILKDGEDEKNGRME
ncbi:MAG: hypothetical protein NTY64_22960 [Deltaproteobacteria bacterium]|nr:hypothetical protein [Deltaproteobacteria bacterium]